MGALSSLSSTLTSAVNDVQSRIRDVQEQLASGKKNLNPAETGVVTRLSAQVTGFKAVNENVTQAQNVISVAQTGLSTVSKLITQMQNLANQASSGTLSSTDISSLQTTFNALAKQVSAVATNADVNGSNLLNSATGIKVQTGIDGTAASQTTVAGVDIAAMGTALEALDISTVAGATAAVTALATNLASTSSGQSQLSAASVGLTGVGDQASSLATSLQNTISSIEDVDQTALQGELQKLNNQQSIDFYLINQMNEAQSAVLTIFR